MSHDTDISISDKKWLNLVENTEAVIMAAVSSVRDESGEPQPGELSIALVSDTDIQELNHTYRDKDKPTNVLSFPAIGPAPIMGDIIIARETVIREAQEKQISVKDHLQHMVIHGYLHLSGYDHETESDAQIMESLEIRALARLGVANPYEALNV